MKITTELLKGMHATESCVKTFRTTFPKDECNDWREFSAALLGSAHPAAPGWVIEALARSMPTSEIRVWLPDLPPEPRDGTPLWYHAYLFAAYGRRNGRGPLADCLLDSCAARTRIAAALDVLDPPGRRKSIPLRASGTAELRKDEIEWLLNKARRSRPKTSGDACLKSFVTTKLLIALNHVT